MPQTDFNQQEQLAEARRLRRLEQRKRQRVQIRLVLFVLLIIAVLSAVLIFRGCRADKTAANQPSAPKAASNQITTEPDLTITVAAVGDIMIDDDLLAAALQEKWDIRLLAQLRRRRGHDRLRRPHARQSRAELRGRTLRLRHRQRAGIFAMALAGVGFDVVQTANSASIQNGLRPAKHHPILKRRRHRPRRHLCCKQRQIGKRRRPAPQCLRPQGSHPRLYQGPRWPLSLPHGSEYAVDLLYTDYATDFDKIATDAINRSLDAANALQPDVILAMLHWGSESDRTVTASQERIAKLLFAGGVDAIIGTHSHIVGPMETSSVTTDAGKDKTCFVAYSLGNFYSTMDSSVATNCRDGVVLNLSFTKNGETGETALSGVSYTPTYFADHGEDASPRYEILPRPHRHHHEPLPFAERRHDRYHRPSAHLYAVRLRFRQMMIIQKLPLPYAARAVCYLLLRNPTATMIAASSTAALMPSQIQPDVPPALSCAGVSLLPPPGGLKLCAVPSGGLKFPSMPSGGVKPLLSSGRSGGVCPSVSSVFPRSKPRPPPLFIVPMSESVSPLASTAVSSPASCAATASLRSWQNVRSAAAPVSNSSAVQNFVGSFFDIRRDQGYMPRR